MTGFDPSPDMLARCRARCAATGFAPDLTGWTAPNGDLLTLEGVRSRTDWFRQRPETTYRYERWRDHQLIETQIDIMAQRFWGLDEFRMTLEAAGFADISVVGDYDRSRGVRSGDRGWTFEARKP
jgi:hypothetical protein